MERLCGGSAGRAIETVAGYFTIQMPFASMTDWDPKSEMGLLEYLKFKLRGWVQVSTLPDWVNQAHDGYFEGFIDKYGQRPYNVEKVYRGDHLEYKIYHKAVAQGQIEDEYYVRIKGWLP